MDQPIYIFINGRNSFMNWNKFSWLVTSLSSKLFVNNSFIVSKSLIKKLKNFSFDSFMISLKFLMQMLVCSLSEILHQSFLISKLISYSEKKLFALRFRHLKVASDWLSGVCNLLADIHDIHLLRRLVKISLNSSISIFIVLFGRTIIGRTLSLRDAFILGQKTIQVQLFLHVYQQFKNYFKKLITYNDKIHFFNQIGSFQFIANNHQSVQDLNNFYCPKMNPFIYQTEGIQCNCFNNNEDSKESGLKPSRNFLTNTNPLVFHRATKSTQSKVQKEQTSRIKTSLRRQKPKTPNQSTLQQEIAQKPQIEGANLNPRSSILGENQTAKLKWNNLNQVAYINNQQKIQSVRIGIHPNNLQEKRPSLIRNQAPKQNYQNFKNDFNELDQKKINQSVANSQVRIVYQNSHPANNNYQTVKTNPTNQFINPSSHINIHHNFNNINPSPNPHFNQNQNSNYPNHVIHSNNNINFHGPKLSSNISGQFNNTNFQKVEKSVKFKIDQQYPHPLNSNIPQNHPLKHQSKPFSASTTSLIRKKEPYETPVQENQAKTSRNSKPGSLRGSGYQSQEGLPQPQPFRMLLKQIQSVADDNDIIDDQMSEVIGRGWEQDRKNSSFQNSYEDFYKDERLRTQTHATRTSHIKNSSGIYSPYESSKRK